MLTEFTMNTLNITQIKHLHVSLATFLEFPAIQHVVKETAARCVYTALLSVRLLVITKS